MLMLMRVVRAIVRGTSLCKRRRIWNWIGIVMRRSQWGMTFIASEYDGIIHLCARPSSTSCLIVPFSFDLLLLIPFPLTFTS